MLIGLKTIKFCYKGRIMTKNDDSLAKIGLQNYTSIQMILDRSLKGGMQNDNQVESDTANLLSQSYRG